MACFSVKHDIKPYIKQPNMFFQISGIIVIWWTKHLAVPRLHSFHGLPTAILRLAREPSETIGILKPMYTSHDQTGPSDLPSAIL